MFIASLNILSKIKVRLTSLGRGVDFETSITSPSRTVLAESKMWLRDGVVSEVRNLYTKLFNALLMMPESVKPFRDPRNMRAMLKSEDNYLALRS